MSIDTGIGGLFADFYEGSGGGGAPSVAWGEAATGFEVKGVLVKVEKTEQTKPGTKRGDPDHILRYDSGDARTQLEFTLATSWRNYEGISEDTVAKMKESERADDGQRRVYVKGSPKQETTTNGAFLKALKDAGVQFTEVALGSTVTFVKTGKHTNPYGGAKIPDFSATYARPTPESLAVYSALAPAAAAPAGGDPWSTEGSAVKDDTPPF